MMIVSKRLIVTYQRKTTAANNVGINCDTSFCKLSETLYTFHRKECACVPVAVLGCERAVCAMERLSSELRPGLLIL